MISFPESALDDVAEEIAGVASDAGEAMDDDAAVSRETQVAEVAGAAETATETAEAPSLEDQIAALQAEATRLAYLLDRKNEKDAELRELETSVASAEGCIEDLKAAMKSAKEHFDNCVDRLRAAVRRRETGQGELPFGQSPVEEETTATVAASPVEERTPIAVLSVEEMRLLIGAEEMKAAKEREEPVGLTPVLMNKMAEGEVNEVQDLEVMMRESAYWWKDLKLGEKGMQRVIETLRVWRLHNPYPVEETPDETPDVIPMTAAAADTASESAS